jgi:hypothetical protein
LVVVVLDLRRGKDLLLVEGYDEGNVLGHEEALRRKRKTLGRRMT